MESFLRPVASCAGPSNTANTRAIEKHEPCGFAITVIDHQSTTPVFHYVDRSEDGMKNFVRMLIDLARDIHKQKSKYHFHRGNGNLLNKSRAKQCWICGNDFDVEDDPESTIDSDHYHFSGIFFGWAHEKCNRARRYVNFIPVVRHNIQNYDFHHICLTINECKPTSTIHVIPATDEYISMAFGVLIETITTDEGKTKKIYEFLRFIDSYKMTNSSLEKLTEAKRSLSVLVCK